jgi:MoaA/NifB/PqqE/SkfB family radical SAM enzyme
LFKIEYSGLEFFEIRLSGFVKNPDIFLRKCQKCVEELNELFNVFKEVHFGSFWKKKLLVRICGKFTRALTAHPIFYQLNTQ